MKNIVITITTLPSQQHCRNTLLNVPYVGYLRYVMLRYVM